MNSNSTKLSLKLPPEVDKIMPWIISAKASGKPKLSEWAKREYEMASQRAREREFLEQRRLAREREWQLMRDHDAQMVERERQLREDVWRKWLVDWESRHPRMEYERYVTPEDGFLPAQSSQKGWRRLLSEYDDLLDHYDSWGDHCGSGHRSWRNQGRKPRKPWFK